MTLLERLGAHAVSGYRLGLAGTALEEARLHLADSVGAWIAAGAIDEGRALRRFDSGTVFRAGRAGCALARLSKSTTSTVGHHPAASSFPRRSSVPPPGRAGPTLLSAIAVGYDLMTWLGAALGGRRPHHGIWPTYLTAPFTSPG